VSELERAAETVVRRCLGVREGEDILVVCDATTLELATALRAEAAAVAADAVLAWMDERATDGTEPPPTVAAALAAADAFVAPTAKSLSHTAARKAASDAGVRGATMPGVTVVMLSRVMSVDFETMAARSGAVAELLSAAGEAHVTCRRGSDLRLDLSGRAAISDDGDLTAPGAFGNLPCGEGFVSPAGGEGAIVASSLPPDGLAVEPARLTVADGALAGAEGPAGERYLAMLEPHGAAGRNLAELGVGTNDRATLTGNILEDEKILGTVHVAFGASAGIGGTVSVPIHLDVVVTDASLTVDGTPVLEQGRFVL
jgi:aminopeptidase